MIKHKQVFYNHCFWEKDHSRMWKKLNGEEKNYAIKQSFKVMSDAEKFYTAMIKVIREWPIVCEHNFTNNSQNRRAWLGHAACCIAVGSPEETTRIAWWKLTQKQRDDADEIAELIIEVWGKFYKEDQLCQKN